MIPRLPTRRQALALPLASLAARASRRIEEVRRLPAPEAHQAVAVDAASFYAIGNHVIARYDKRTGRRMGGWECQRAKPLIHLNSGIVREGVLYCAHSNYPAVPMISSIETWDARTLRHTGSHSFGIEAGSATWVEFRGERRYVNFAHYGSRAGEPNRDPRWTTLVEYDAGWRRLQGWVYPEEVLAKLGSYSISGGAFGPAGDLFCTGHDEPELYVLGFPEGGSTLVLKEIVPAPLAGQGIAFDPEEPGMLWGIDRAARQVVAMRLRAG